MLSFLGNLFRYILWRTSKSQLLDDTRSIWINQQNQIFSSCDIWVDKIVFIEPTNPRSIIIHSYWEVRNTRLRIFQISWYFRWDSFLRLQKKKIYVCERWITKFLAILILIWFSWSLPNLLPFYLIRNSSLIKVWIEEASFWLPPIKSEQYSTTGTLKPINHRIRPSHSKFLSIHQNNQYFMHAVCQRGLSHFNAPL